MFRDKVPGLSESRHRRKQLNRRPDSPGKSPKNNMKKYLPYLITAVVAIVAVKVVYPMVQPQLAKLPLVGSFFVA